MKIILYDTATPHPKGKFCKRVVCNHYFISWFETPFIYEREGKLLRGNVGDMLVIPPGSPVYHGGVPEADTGFVNDWIYFGGTDLQLLFEKYPLPLCTAFPMGPSASGFQSIHYFSKYFKEVMGITPSSYAKDCRDF